MEIAKILKNNSITQEELGQYVGQTRECINKKLKRNNPEEIKCLLNQVKFMVAEKRGIKIDIKL